MVDYQRLPQHDQGEDISDGHVAQPDNRARGIVNFRKKRTLLLPTVFALLATTAYLLGVLPKDDSLKKIYYKPVGTSASTFDDGVAKCEEISRRSKHPYPPPESRTRNPRFVNGTRPTLFKNGHVYDGENEPFKGDVLVDQGIIVHIGGEIKFFPKDTIVVDLKGHILTPGIVDMPSHLGLYSLPKFEFATDGNEDSTPIVPFARSIDGFNPSDKAREIVLSGGITSTLVLPGSHNIMGGEGYALKLHKTDTLSVEDMLVEAGVQDNWRYMKMACGENPIRNYRPEHKMPKTRLGSGWLLREQFAKARKLKRAQDDWCLAAEDLTDLGRRNFDHRLDTPYPEDLQYESLVGILRGYVKLNIHCYETYDIEAMVRHSNEFKFQIAAFHHALDAYRIPEILKRAYKNVPTVATFASKFGYKKEAFQSSVNSPKILVDAGIPVALKSDHPIVNAQNLMFDAAQAHHNGLTELQALASVTTVPAKALGLDHRIGKIALGMDADLVIWEKHPLSLGAHPLQVYIDGIAQIENVDTSKWSSQGEPQEFKKLPEMVIPKHKDACTQKSEDAIFVGIKKILLKNSKSARDEYSADGGLSVIIRDGEIVCTGRCDDSLSHRGDIPVYDLGGEGVVLPSMVSAGTINLGLHEIALEEVTGDGHPGLTTPVVKAIDGLKFGGLHMDEAFKAGVLVGVTVPVAEHVVQGISVAFSTGAEDALSHKNAILKERVALHVTVGQAIKSQLFPSISSQIGYLRDSLERALHNAPSSASSLDHFAQVVKGQLPLVVNVENRDEMIRLVQMKKDLEAQGARLKVTFVGATEAWTLAQHLAKAEVGVILRPYRCLPMQWDSQKCLTGAPLTQDTGLSILHKAGVKVGLAAEEPEDVRLLAWMAGWARSDLGLAEKEAAGLVSWNLAELVGLDTDVLSGLVLYNGDPFEFGAKVAAIVGGGRDGIECNPRAF
ncbi:hypothetical protein BGZ94_006821 [Podila epigama]|nr:hypothetical protein BGZ94_006821 [Podila epigama]